MSGKAGDLIVRCINGEYYVVKPPFRRKDPTENQVEHRKRFSKALRYAARATREGSPKREAYVDAAEREGRQPKNVAVSDWFHPPEIEDVDFSEYHGRAGDKIVICLVNEARVHSVRLTISEPDGNTIERGHAVRTAKLEWTYTATEDLPGDDATFTISVRDLPGNVTEESMAENLENFGDLPEDAEVAAAVEA